MRTPVVDPGDEPWAGGGCGRVTDSVTPLLATFRGQRILLTLGGAARPRLAQVDQSPAAGLVAGWDQTLGHRELVGRQLGVPLRVVLADRRLAGLDVDDHQPAF